MDRYEFKIKPQECPKCGSDRIADIEYGLPGPDFFEKYAEELEAEKFTLGGCCVTGDDPRWKCMNCRTVIYQESLRFERTARNST